MSRHFSNGHIMQPGIKRPVNLALHRMQFPPMAIVSILHRISGVLIFLLLPFALYLLSNSLQSQFTFIELRHTFPSPLFSFLSWVLISSVGFHFFAGLRHMIMDCGFFESLKAARITAYIILFLGVVICVLSGVWVW